MTVEIIATGGSIAELFENGGVRHLSGDELVSELLRGSQISAEVRVKDLLALPSTWITPENMRAIGYAVLEAHADPTIAGVVVSHGTATLEETAFFVDLMIDGEKPVVFTGAQRYPGGHGYDGYRNLQDAVVVASSPAARGLGALALMNGELHLARDVVKMHAGSMAAFASPGWGPIGGVHMDIVRVMRRPIQRFDRLAPSGPMPRVDIVATYTGADGALLDAAVARGAKGVVVQGMSSVGLPATIVDPIRDALAENVAVVVVSGCIESGVIPGSLAHRGIAGYSAELADLGVAISGLQPLKARCRLIALLASGRNAEEAISAMNDIG